MAGPGSRDQDWAGNGAGAGHVRRVGQRHVQQIKRLVATAPVSCHSVALLTKGRQELALWDLTAGGTRLGMGCPCNMCLQCLRAKLTYRGG